MVFDIAPDGSGITRFRATDVPGDTCTFGEVEIEFATPLAINDHMFNRSVNTDFSFSGEFPSPGAAQGTWRNKSAAIPFVQPACDSGTISWTATTAVEPTPTPTATATATATATPTKGATATPTETPSEGLPIEGLNDCLGVTNIAWGHDNQTKEWMSFDPDLPPFLQQLPELLPHGGYLVNASGDCTIHASDGAEIDLYTDWNVLGY